MPFRFRRRRSDDPREGRERWSLRRLQRWTRRSRERLGPHLARAVRRRRARLRLARTAGGGFGRHPDPSGRTSLVWGLVVIVLLVFGVMLTAALRPRVVARPLVEVGVEPAAAR